MYQKCSFIAHTESFNILICKKFNFRVWPVYLFYFFLWDVQNSSLLTNKDFFFLKNIGVVGK